MEKEEVIANLNSTTKMLSKIVKINCLPPDLEVEVCNLHYDLLTLICRLQENVSNEEEQQCP